MGHRTPRISLGDGAVQRLEDLEWDEDFAESPCFTCPALGVVARVVDSTKIGDDGINLRLDEARTISTAV